MADRTRQRASHQTLDSMMEFEDHELQATMQEFLEEEKKANTNIWNFATIAGIAMFFAGVIFLIQSIGLSIGPDLSGLLEVLPLAGGILVTLVGFGFFVGDRKKERRRRKKRRKSRDRQPFRFEEEAESFGLDNDLDERSRNRHRRGTKDFDFEPYAFRKSKKLYKSRTDRKWTGVCGGLAKYFGISSTVVRLLFVITFFAGSGASMLAYIALAIALDKEPPEMMDDFDF